jgi:hypothetical protein
MRVTGCQFDPFSWEYTRSEVVERRDLVGEYLLDAETRRWYAKEIQATVPSAKLRLLQGGAFHLSDMPDCLKTARMSQRVSHPLRYLGAGETGRLLGPQSAHQRHISRQ